MLRHVLSAGLTILLCSARVAYAQSPPPAATPAFASVAPGVSPSPSSAALINSLDAADLQQALPIIKNNYVAPDALGETALHRATLEGLLGRLGGRVMLLPARNAGAAPPPPAFYREIIDGHIGYLRPGALGKTDLEEMDKSLRGFGGKKVNALVLDLRGSVDTNDYAMAAEFAKRFVPKGKPLFALRGPTLKPERVFSSSDEPAYTGFIVVLIDQETKGAPEVLAGVLRFYGNAILIGETTAADAVEYSDLPLPSGKILRVAVSEAVLSDQKPLFAEGVKPDLPVALPAAQKQQIFQQSLTKGMTPFVFEGERPHFNEAALLEGTNPEIEAAQAAQQHRTHGGEKAALHDAPLQRAVDLVTSIAVYQKQASPSP